MGETYWILVWDGWGAGLNMDNPRLLTQVDCPYEGSALWGAHPDSPCLSCGTTDGRHQKSEVDFKGVPRNSWSDRQKMTDDEIQFEHNLDDRFGPYWKVIR